MWAKMAACIVMGWYQIWKLSVWTILEYWISAKKIICDIPALNQWFSDLFCRMPFLVDYCHCSPRFAHSQLSLQTYTTCVNWYQLVKSSRNCYHQTLKFHCVRLRWTYSTLHFELHLKKKKNLWGKSCCFGPYINIKSPACHPFFLKWQDFWRVPNFREPNEKHGVQT